jgi:hypothetical protein
VNLHYSFLLNAIGIVSNPNWASPTGRNVPTSVQFATTASTGGTREVEDSAVVKAEAINQFISPHTIGIVTLSGARKREKGTNEGTKAAKSATAPQAATGLQSETRRGNNPSSTGIRRTAQTSATSRQMTQQPKVSMTRSVKSAWEVFGSDIGSAAILLCDLLENFFPMDSDVSGRSDTEPYLLAAHFEDDDLDSISDDDCLIYFSGEDQHLSALLGILVLGKLRRQLLYRRRLLRKDRMSHSIRFIVQNDLFSTLCVEIDEDRSG